MSSDGAGQSEEGDGELGPRVRAGGRRGAAKDGGAGDGGPAKSAVLAGPKGIAYGPKGDIYLADTESHTIRVIRKATGIIETLVGDGKPGDGPDGDPKKCRLNRPHGIFVDANGTVYIGDSSNHKVRVYRPESRFE